MPFKCCCCVLDFGLWGFLIYSKYKLIAKERDGYIANIFSLDLEFSLCWEFLILKKSITISILLWVLIFVSCLTFNYPKVYENVLLEVLLFYILCLGLWSVLIFMYSARWGTQFFASTDMHLIQCHSLKGPSSPHWLITASLSYVKGCYLCGTIPVLCYILLLYLFFHQQHIVFILL